MTVHRYLVTDDDAPCECAWMATCAFANWIEGRCTPGRAAAETWLVTCFAEDAEAFLSAAKTAGVTVEEIEGAGDSETYKLLAGAPGSGWADVHGKPPQHVAPEDDCDDEPCGHECDEPVGVHVMTQCCPMDTYDTDSAGDLRTACECLDGCACMCPDCACASWGDDDYDDGPQ